MADSGVSLQIVTQLAVGQEALLSQEVGALLAGLAPHGEVRAPGTWGGAGAVTPQTWEHRTWGPATGAFGV